MVDGGCMNPDVLFVTGTDTGVGKTVVCMLLMQLLHEKGRNPFYIKAVQTGCRDVHDEESDARFIYRHVPALTEKDPSESVIHCFKNPKAPYFAARDEGARIDPLSISEIVERRRSSHSPVVLEGAGGLFVPVNEETLMIDMIKMLNAKPIIVARAGLGTINHTLLSIEALRARGLNTAGIVLMDSGEIITPQEMIRENIEAVERFSGAKVAGVITRIEDFSTPERGCYQPLLAMLDRI
jgi:dethiobiotin synthetase